jgi:hemolysin activation/secretion protein
MNGLKLVSVLLCLVALTTLPAFADTTILERDRSDRQAPPKPLAVPKPAQQEAHAPEVGNFAPFVLRHVEIEGSSLADAEILSVTSRFIGQTMDRPAIESLAKELSAVYAKSDVALYSIVIPDQSGENGNLRIVAIEGTIDEVLVSGDTDQANLVYAQRILAPVVNQAPLRRSTLERVLSLLAMVPGNKVEPRFLATDKRGIVKLAVALKTQSFGAGLGVATRGTSNLGRTEMQLDLTANALLRAGDRTTASFGAPLDFERFRYYGFAHQTPLNADGLTLSGNVGYLETHPRGIDLEGKATTAGLQLSYPLILSYKEALILGIGFDGLNSDNALLGESISSDRTRVARLSAGYTRLIDDARFSALISASQGVDAFGARTLDPMATDLTFLKFNGQAGYEQPLGKRFILRLAAAAQYSGDALPSSEQGALGGTFGRAFDAAIATGDKSLAGSAELGYRIGETPEPLSNTEVYGFIDGGEVWRTARGAISSSSTGLASAGIGTRFTIFSNIGLGFEFAHALENPDTDPGDKGWRFILSFSSRTGP